jgi:hypothetical protein
MTRLRSRTFFRGRQPSRYPLHPYILLRLLASGCQLA